MHPALEVQDPARPEQPARTLSDTASSRRRQGVAWLWLAALLVIVSLSLADGLMSDTVAYERDTAVFYFPLMTWVGQQLRHGVFPLWTPQFFGGYPIFADGEIGLAYPPVVLALLTLPADRAFVAMRLLHVCLAAAGMFVLARAWRLPYPSAVVAGLTFALGNFLQAQIHHENIVRTASWLPLLLALTEFALRADTWRWQLRWTALAALSLGMAGLGLHSQLLAMDLLVLAAYAAFRWAIGPVEGFSNFGRPWFDRFLGVARTCVPIVVLGLGLAAVQLAPLIELAGFSPRGAGIPYSDSAAYSLTPPGLIQALFPYFFRGPASLQWGLWTHWEAYLYFGVVPLLLAVIALVCVRRREIIGWALIGAIGLVLALGQYSPVNLHYLLWLLPGLSGLRAPGRFTLVVVLAAAMLAAYGMAWLISTSEAAAVRSSIRLRRLLIAGAAVVAVIAVGLAGAHLVATTWPDGIRSTLASVYLSAPRDTYRLTVDDVLNGLLWSTDLHNPRVLGGLVEMAAAIAAVWLWRVSRWRLWPAVLIALAAIDLLTFDWAIHPREPLARIAAEPAAVQAIEQLPASDAAPNRILASPVLNQVAPDRLAPFGTLQEVNGYSSLEFTWHHDYLGRVLYVDDALLDLWNVRYILDPAHFGALSNADGVDFLPEQALLHAPAGSALSEQQFALGSTVSINELRFVTALMGAVDVPQGAPVAEIELRDALGQIVGTAELQAGRDSMDWAWDVPSVQASIKHLRVQTAAETEEHGGPQPSTRELSLADFVFASPVGAASITVRAVPPTGEFVLYGGAVVDTDGSLHQLFGKTDTRYRQVYADDQIRVLENTAAFPRAFVVPSARVAPSLGKALNEMVHQPFQPNQEVILSDDPATQAAVVQGQRGGQGRATVTSYSANDVRVHASASGDAWLVLSDTYYPGWSVTVDGRPSTVLRGDVLFRVVPVPAGEHDVEFRFEPASVKLGLLISGLAAVLVGAALVIAGMPAWQRRTT